MLGRAHGLIGTVEQRFSLAPAGAVATPLLQPSRSLVCLKPCVILPAVPTPTGVLLLRQQYMRTIPDELLEAARMDSASEWHICWKIVLPLAAPATAVLATF